MPYSTSNNTSYGGPEGFNKYTALSQLRVGVPERTDSTALSNGRINLLADANVFPGSLDLVLPDWNTTIGSELGVGGVPKRPPLVVISSNRARYIAAGIQTATVQRGALGLANYNNVTDLRALAGAQTAPSPPLYSPLRLGANPSRNVYVVVHFAEYNTYKAALGGLGVTVVGWQFQLPPGTPMATLSGFGASRYAAIEFCKHLRNRAIAHGAGNNPMWDKAWLLDDNVIGIDRFSDFTPAEAALGANQVCVGFRGLITPQTRSQNRTWANSAANKTGAAPPALPASTAPNLVQQVALWNIAHLTTNNLNFGPIFVASKEDLSFTSYFDSGQIQYDWYNLAIRKEIVPGMLYDNAPGAQAVNLARASYVTSFARLEQNTTMLASGIQGALRQYVTNVVLPKSSYLSAKAGDAATQQLGVCHSVEQIITRAIKGNFQAPPAAPPFTTYLAAGAADLVFRLAAPQAVTRHDVP